MLKILKRDLKNVIKIAVNYLNLNFKSTICVKCESKGAWRGKGTLKFRCNKRLCKFETTKLYGTIFLDLKQSFLKVFNILYAMIRGTDIKTIIHYEKTTKSTIKKIIVRWYKKNKYNILSEFTQIGGEDKVVEIDESKFGKRKYHRGHKVDGVWVLGMVERETSKLIMVPLKSKKAKELEYYITKYVKKGTTIMTDYWKGYNNLGNLGYIHKKVNHSNTYKDPITGAHTNTIEGTWNGVKYFIKPRYRNKKIIKIFLYIYMFKTNNYIDLNFLIKTMII